MTNSEKLILEMLDRADARLQAQQQIAIASDARAMQMVSVLIASAAVTMAIGWQDAWTIKLAIVVPLILAAICGIYAARPVAWHAPGMQPSAFDDDLKSDRSHSEVMVELAGHLERSIRENNNILSKNADALRLASYLGLAAPCLGFLAALAS